jgi:hypothetical protein
MTAAPMPRPATAGQAFGWWLALWLFQLHFTLCRWHLRRSETMKSRCPWLVWAKVEARRE